MTVVHISETQVLTIAGPGKVDITGGAADNVVFTDVKPPTIELLEPDTAVCGEGDLDLIVTGANFNEATKITFNGLDEPTKFISDTEVSTGVKPSLFHVAAVCPVGVRTGAMKSNTLDFTFTESAARGRKR
jgi:hypothetical protein